MEKQKVAVSGVEFQCPMRPSESEKLILSMTEEQRMNVLESFLRGSLDQTKPTERGARIVRSPLDMAMNFAAGISEMLSEVPESSDKPKISETEVVYDLDPTKICFVTCKNVDENGGLVLVKIVFNGGATLSQVTPSGSVDEFLKSISIQRKNFPLGFAVVQ